MKLVSYSYRGQSSFGVLLEDRIVDARAACEGQYATLQELIAADDMDSLKDFDADAANFLDLGEVKLEKPIANPGKIICVGLNYRSHIEETGMKMPDYPTLFTRYNDSLVAAGEEMLRPRVSEKYDFEGEMAVVVGKRAFQIERREEAMAYVAGYTCFNDGSVRDFQRHSSQFTPGKNFYHSGAVGPWMVTAEALGDGSGLKLETRLNGEIMQHASTDELVFDVADLIVYISQVMPLEPGDIISTGTTGGVGYVRNPRVFMQPGDEIEVEISGIGVLQNKVAAAP